jgi:hypothetical protein
MPLRLLVIYNIGLGTFRTLPLFIKIYVVIFFKKILWVVDKDIEVQCTIRPMTWIQFQCLLCKQRRKTHTPLNPQSGFSRSMLRSRNRDVERIKKSYICKHKNRKERT